MLNEKIESTVKLIPIVYPLIIFLGYFNYHVYYGFFDIEIFQYLNISELLFSFISMIIPIFIILFFVLCYFVFLFIAPNTINKDEIKDLDEEIGFDDSNLSENYRRLRAINKNKEVNISLIFNKSQFNFVTSWTLFIRKIKQKKYSRAISHFISFCSSLIGFVIKFSLWLFFIIFTISSIDLIISPIESDLNNLNLGSISTFKIVIFILIWSSIVYAIIYRSRKRIEKNYINSIQIVPIIFIVLFLITLFQKIKVDKVINLHERNIKLIYNGKNVQSNSEIIFIGKTSDYIFLRDMKNQTNYIYPIKDVSNLEIQFIHKKKKSKENREEK